MDAGRQPADRDQVPAPEGDAAAAQAPPDLAISPLLLALRLAATLGSEAGFDRMLTPRATTVIRDLRPGEGSALDDLLLAGILPAGWRRLDRHDAPPQAQNGLVALCIAERSGKAQAPEAARLAEMLATLLEAEAPVLILAPATACLPPSLQAPELARRVAPFDRAIILRALQERFGAVDLAEVSRILPPDAQLRRLDTIDLHLALRAPGATAAGQHIARRLAPPEAGLTLQGLAGYGDAKAAAIGLIEDLAAWQQGDLPWSDLCHGILLCGPPGVGKTELARAMAREGAVAFISASYADWQAQGHLGHFLAAMQASFAEARAAAPAILFLDELDAFGSRSGAAASGSRNHSYDTKAIAGRFDRILQIDPPGQADLAVILRQHLGRDLPQADLHRLAAHAVGRTGADCAAALRIARSHARQQRRAMTEADLDMALLGPTGDAQPEAVWRAALHEAGHAVMNRATGIGVPVGLILRSGGGQCLARLCPHAQTADAFRRLGMVHLAGRAAERLILGSVGAGAGGARESDLAMATRLVLAEEVSLGTGTLGPLWLAADPDPELIPHLPIEVQRVLRTRLARLETAATRILTANRPALLAIARALHRAQVMPMSEADTDPQAALDAEPDPC